ncbi:MAG: 4Fe-4S dicluster domain-containing protein [Candidatus Brocadiae bacterium]|nr:4Fe-4S dicluster domain-containing protein [Candidatus Brocadiia bacterium]
MTEKRIPHTDLDGLLGRLRERGAVYAPARDDAGDVALTQAPLDDPMVLEYRNFRLSPKAFFLPQSQTLLTFCDGEAHEPSLPDGETFLVGVRPCDAKALLALDKVFLDGDPPDPYYARLRETTTVIALACTRPMSSCFCTSVGGGPGDGAGADVLAVGLEADLLLRAQTPKGEELLSSVADLLADATDDAVKEAEKRVGAAESLIAPVEVDNSAQRLRDGYDSPCWETASQTCLGCGTCSFLCPTCHCFDITDELRGTRGRRVRTWDCCAYPLFTLHGSGHNPRPSPKERWRQRIMHKFRYAVENLDRLFCVGCGRCIRNCPASMDLRTVLRELGA